MPDPIASSTTKSAPAVRSPGRPPRGQAPDLRLFATDRLLAGLAQAREAIRTLSIAQDHPVATVHQALVADITQAEASARMLRRALEA